VQRRQATAGPDGEIVTGNARLMVAPSVIAVGLPAAPAVRVLLYLLERDWGVQTLRSG